MIKDEMTDGWERELERMKAMLNYTVFLVQGNLGYDGIDELGIYSTFDGAGLLVEQHIKAKDKYFSYHITEVPVDSPLIAMNHWEIDGYLATKKIRTWQAIKVDLQNKVCEATA